MNGPNAYRERVTRVALFGVRFRDVATRQRVFDGLEVTLFRPQYKETVVTAFNTRGGAFARHRLPRMPRWDLGEGDAAFWSQAQAASRPFVVEVRDRLGRYHDFAFRVDLPRRDMIVPAPAAAAAFGFADSLPLFPACARPNPHATAVVRADLVDAASLAPLSWALVRVEFAGAQAGIGVAGSDGKVAVMFNHPPPSRPPAALPGGPPPPRPDMFAWDLALRIHNGGLRAPFAGRDSDLPDVDDLLGQLAVAPSRPLQRITPSTPMPNARLELGRELVFKTIDSPLSCLHVRPPA